MKVLRDKQKLGQVAETDIHIDWDRLLSHKGALAHRFASEKFFGRALRHVSYALFGVAVILGLISGELNLSSFTGANWVMSLLLGAAATINAYGQFLGRDFQDFAFNLSNRTKLRQVDWNYKQKVEVNDFIAISVWEAVDKAYYLDSGQQFLQNFAKELFGAPGVVAMFERLGVHDQARQHLIESVSVHKQDLADHTDLILNALRLSAGLESENIEPENVVIVMWESLLISELARLGVNLAEMNAVKAWIQLNNRKYHYQQIWKRMSLIKPKGTVNRAYTSRYAPTLEQFGEDYTLSAATGEFLLSIGKEEQMRLLMRTMQQEEAATLIIGRPGVGKTHFLKYLAVRMVVEDVVPAMRDHRLVAFDLSKAFTTSQSIENFKQVLLKMFEEVAASGDIILVLDNLDLALDVRDDLQSEIVNLIDGAITKYKIRVIATASTNGYNRFIKAHRGLSGRFKVVELIEPAAATALQILVDEAAAMEKKSGVKFELPALREIVNLATKFDHDRVLPDKGVAIMEEALFEAQDKELNSVSRQVVDTVISRKVGVSVGKLSESEASKLMNLEKELHERVVGQTQAIKAVANALRRARAGLQKSAKPVASFLFFGPTGVGKTEVARTLAATYYGAEKLMIRIDMSEFQESDNLKRLIGAEENGEFIGGQLTEAVRSKPFSLVLFDEVEKANPKVLDLLLQILDEGHITDGLGRKVDFTNTIIILTSNAGSRSLAERISRGERYHEVYSAVLPELRTIFRVEFLNRFDQIIMFKPLTPVEIQQVADQMLHKLQDQLLEQGYHFTYTKTVLEELTKLGYSAIYGARQMSRAIQEHVEDKLAAAIVSGKLTPGGTFSLESLEG